MLQNSTSVGSSTFTGSNTFLVPRALHKFGGSSLADVGCFLRVARIIQEHCGDQDLFVVSAAGKTTNRLVAFADNCGHDPFIARVELASLFEFQLELVNGLLSGEQQKKIGDALRTEFTVLRGFADAIVDTTQRANILAHGEVWSARLLSALLNEFGALTTWLDSREVLRAKVGGQPVINQVQSKPLVQHAIEALHGQRVVVTGFMARDEEGKTVLLGRNGSDYSATMFGILAESPCVTIWSDVPGIYTADPNKVDTARLLPSISVAEANELARIGAPVLHRRSLQPVIEHQANVALRSSYDPQGGTTAIEQSISTVGAKVVTSVNSIALLTLSSPSGESCERFTAFATEALTRAQLQPVAVNASNTHGAVQFLFLEEFVDDAVRCLESAGFTVHMAEEQHALVAVVGAGVAHSASEHEKFLDAIELEGCCGAPVLVVSTDLSLIAVIKSTDTAAVLKNVHAVMVCEK